MHQPQRDAVTSERMLLKITGKILGKALDRTRLFLPSGSRAFAFQEAVYMLFHVVLVHVPQPHSWEHWGTYKVKCVGGGGKSSLLRGWPLNFRTLPGVRTESLEEHPPLTLHDPIPEFPEAPRMAGLPMAALHLCFHWYFSASTVRSVDNRVWKGYMKPDTDDIICKASYFPCLALPPHIVCGKRFSRYPGCLPLAAGARAPGILGLGGSCFQ